MIDDYFAVSVLPCCQSSDSSVAFRHHNQAQQAYASQQLQGSPHKDVLGSDCAKIIGGVLNSSPQARSQGVATLASRHSQRSPLPKNRHRTKWGTRSRRRIGIHKSIPLRS